MRTFICIILAALGRGMSEKRVQFKLAATVAYEAVPSRAEALGEAAGLREVKRVFRHAPKHEAKHRAQGLHLWYTGAAATPRTPIAPSRSRKRTRRRERRVDQEGPDALDGFSHATAAGRLTGAPRRGRVGACGAARADAGNDSEPVRHRFEAEGVDVWLTRDTGVAAAAGGRGSESGAPQATVELVERRRLPLATPILFDAFPRATPPRDKRRTNAARPWAPT